MSCLYRLASTVTIAIAFAFSGLAQESQTETGFVARDWYWSEPDTQSISSTEVARPATPAPTAGPIVPPEEPLRPLAMRISVRQLEEGWYEEVDTDAAFSTGDRIKVRVEVNDSASLYVVAQGASGRWSALFPTDEISNGDNRVDAYRQYDVPPGDYVWTFAPPPGPEKVIVIAAREPVEALDEVLYLAQSRSDSGPKQLFENVSVSDALIGDMGVTMRARDLVLDKVEDVESDRHAIYVADLTRSDQGYVFAELTLRHEESQ